MPKRLDYSVNYKERWDAIDPPDVEEPEDARTPEEREAERVSIMAFMERAAKARKARWERLKRGSEEKR